MTVDDALCLAAAALAGDRTAIRAIADAIDERASAAGAFWTATAPPRLRLLAGQADGKTAGGLALLALRHEPSLPVMLGKPRHDYIRSEAAVAPSSVAPDSVIGPEDEPRWPHGAHDLDRPGIRPVLAIR